MIWIFFFVFAICVRLSNSLEGYYQPPRGASVWGYFTPPLLYRVPTRTHQTAMDAMVDLTNNLGVTILKDHSYSKGNFAFSPYGVASVLVVLYEGACGESANQIHRAIGFPFDKDVIRVGFRSIHRHLRSYFSHEGYLSGISLNKEGSTLKPEFKRILKFYGYDVDVNHPVDEDISLEDLPSPATPSAGANVTSPSPIGVTEDDNQSMNNANTTDGNDEKHKDVTTEPGDKTTEKPESTTKDGNDSSEKEEEKPEKTSEDKEKPDEISDVENPEKATEEEKPANTDNSEMTAENAETEKEETDENNSDKTSTQDSDTAEEDKQNPEDGSDSSEKPTDDNKESETPPEDDNTSQEEKENSDSATEDHSQLPEKENEKVCSGKEDCENKTEESTTTAKQEPEEMSITTLSDGLVLNKTEPTQEEEDLQVTSSTIKNLDENTETGMPTPETDVEDSTSENLESPVTSTMDPPQEEETTKVTEESSETEKTTTNLDNGMLIPQSGDLPTSSESSVTEAEGNQESTTPNTTPESQTETTEEGSPAEVTTSEPHSRRKRDSAVKGKLNLWNILLPMNKISVCGVLKLAGVEPTRHARQALLPKLSALYRSRNGRTITDYLKWPPASDVSLQLQNGMFDSHVSRNLEMYKSLPRLMFLVDGAIDTPVPMMTYTHIFPYAYIPRLHTKALEFPLDDVRYKLLILLPVERRGLRQLIYDLTEFPLREVFTALQPTRVRAMIPPFMVEGFVILTSSLQKLGIWDVFDPRKSNLSGMSIDPELYVRNVEQSVTVVIRNYVEILDIQTRTMAARHIEHDFEATHPFLYFVLDTATNVALMAGQILDPLNSRIY